MMKSLPRFAAGAVVIAMLATSSTAFAKIAVVTVTGHVGFGGDQAGLFGAPGGNIVGDSFVVKYTLDSTKGGFVKNLPSSEYLFGGSSYGSTTPVSATITINGNTQSVGGAYDGYAYASLPSAVNPNIYTFGLGSYDIFRSGDNLYDNLIIMQVQITHPDLFSSLSTTDILLTGQATFYISNLNSNTYPIESGGYFSNNGTIQISAGAPEPNAWAAMLVGFGLVGANLRWRLRPTPETGRA